MRIMIPEPKIELYKDGFEKHDKLGRAPTADSLSNLVNKIDDPLVIALDGPWGSGKSFFLKCWVGEHLKREGNTAQTIYFDAFAHDFLDDPLIALTSAIADRLDNGDKPAAAKVWDKAKQAAPALGRFLIRTGVSVGTAGVVTNAGDLVDAAAKTLEGDLAAATKEFWRREDGKRAAMDAFRNALVELTAPDEKGNPTQKLIIVVDELDRCRPDYALSLLEVIKHFFNTDGIHFVLGANLAELENSVRTRYGSGVDAAKYLSKFVTVKTSLEEDDWRGRQTNAHVYFHQQCELLDLSTNQFAMATSRLLELPSLRSKIALRDVERILSQVTFLPEYDTSWSGGSSPLIVSGLIILKVCRPDLYRAAKTGDLSISEVSAFFGLPAPDQVDENTLGWIECLAVGWDYYLNLDRGKYSDENSKLYQVARTFVPDRLDREDRLKLLRELFTTYVEAFRVP